MTDLPSSVSQFASGAALVDNVTPSLTGMSAQSTSLGLLGNIPGFSAVSSALSSLTSAVQSQWSSILSQLPIALPAMKAAHIQEKSMEMANGGVSSAAGSASFQSYFGSVTNVQGQISGLAASVTSSVTAMGATAASIPGVTGTGTSALASLAGQIPTPTLPDPTDPSKTIPNPAYAAFLSTHSAALGSMTTFAGTLATAAGGALASANAEFSNALSMYQTGMANLKAMAFAQFCASPQPAPVQAVISQMVKPAAIAPPDAFTQSRRSTAGWVGGQTREPTIATIRPGPDANSTMQTLPPTYTPPLCSPAQLSAIQAQVASQRQVVVASASAADAAAPAFAAWKAANNYDAVKNAQGSSPEALAAYQALRAQAVANPDYQTLQAALSKYAADKAKWANLVDIEGYMLHTGPWPGNPNGPW